MDIYKFRFYSCSVIFVPEVGHLKPGAVKEILAIFKATSPVLLNKVSFQIKVIESCVKSKL